MKNYEIEMVIHGSTAKVYEALTTQVGIESWWTRSCEVGASVGEQITIKFGETYKVMLIENLRPNAEVSWRVIDAQLHVPGLTHINEWIGTRILFHLEPRPNLVTHMKLEHIGLTPQVECFDICSQGWVQFLGSLKAYVETGKGTPFVGV